MKKLLLFFQKKTKIIKRILLLILTIQNGFSIVNTFSLPIPIPPRTTIGLMTGLGIILIGILLFFLYTNTELNSTKSTSIDAAVFLFVAFQAMSLLLAPQIFQPSVFRLLCTALIQYIVFRCIKFSSKEIQLFILGVMVTGLLLCAISVFQLLFRQQAIVIAKQYFFGDAAYGLVWELTRGRAPHWGNLTISFPFILGGILFLQKNKKAQPITVFGFILLLFFVFIISNFRWLTACFVIGSTLFILLSFDVKKISYGFWLKTSLLIIGTAILGLMISTSVFHYNLIDRIFLYDIERDVHQALGRLYLYNQATHVFERSPIFGIGLGNYSLGVEPIIAPEHAVPFEFKFSETTRQPVSSHSEALTILAEGGIFSFMAFLYINTAVITKLWLRIKQKNQSSIMQTVATTAFISLLMYVCYGLFENIAPNNYIYLFFLYGISFMV